MGADITLVLPGGHPLAQVRVDDNNNVTIRFNGETASMPRPTSAQPTGAESRPAHHGPAVLGVIFRGSPPAMSASLPQVYGGASQSALQADPHVAQAMAQLAQAVSQGVKQTEVFLPVRLQAPVARGEVPLAPRQASEAKDARTLLESHTDPGTGGVRIRGAEVKPDGKTAAPELPEHVPAALQKPLDACQTTLRQLAAIPEQLTAQLAAAANAPPLPTAAAAALNAAGSAYFAKPAAGTEASLMRALFVAGLVTGQEPSRLLGELAGLFAGAQKPDLAILLRYAQSRGATPEVLAQLRNASTQDIAALKRERKPEEMLVDAPRDKRAEGKKATAGRKRVEKLGGDGGGDGRQPFSSEDDGPDDEDSDDEATTEEVEL